MEACDLQDASLLFFIFCSAALRFLPDLLLTLVPFHRHFRLPAGTTFALVTAYALLLAISAPLLYLSFNQWNNGAYPLSLSIFYMAVMLAPLRYLLYAPFPKVLFIFFIIRNYTDAMRFFHKYLEVHFMPKDVQFFDPASCFSANLIVLLLVLPLICLFLTRLLRPMLEKNTDLPLLRYLWIIPASYLILYRISVYSGSFEVDFRDYKLLFLQCLWIVVISFSYYIILRMASETAQNIALQEKLKIETLQVTQQREQYKTLQKNIAQAGDARRDLRCRLSYIKECAACGNYGEIERVLEASLASIRSYESPQLCDNRAADAMLRHYLALAHQNGVEFSVSAELPAQAPIPESDLCIVLGNLLENALEACLRQRAGRRFIELKIRIASRQMVALLVKNSYGGEIHASAGDFFSSKRDGEAFGIGTVSVRAIAEKNGGIAKYVAADGVFQASVLLQAAREK